MRHATDDKQLELFRARPGDMPPDLKGKYLLAVTCLLTS